MGKRLMSQEVFIQKAIVKHKNKYDYSKAIYERSELNVIVICPLHGDFSIIAGNHLFGKGCKNCGYIKIGLKKSSNYDEFSLKSSIIHNNFYNYSLVNYKGSFEDVKIICPFHGVFKIKPTSHLTGQGCPKCMSEKRRNFPLAWKHSSWGKAGNKSERFDSFKVYLIRCWNDEEEFYKIGRTYTSMKNRFSGSKKLPYQYEVIKIYENENPKYICELEDNLKSLNKLFRYIPKLEFKGMHECFHFLESTNV